MIKVTKKQIPLIIIIAVVVALMIVAIILGQLEKGREKAETSLETPRLSAEEKGRISTEIYGFSGEIKEIKDKTLLIEADILMANPAEKSIKAMVKAKVTDRTRIAKLKYPKIPEGSTEPVYPKETKMSFEELKVGNQVDISTIKNISEDIKNGNEFVVNDVFIVE